ncbi:hypothetical protein GCM10010967_24990 [Dyadobacter beijingensis]|uniref:histidine kinase n=1 Tax=Dyadobacter beijingensis TaxID=365489 RepID=A0ABQ2HVK9_9BACT|nr:PAS domain S-box protein [Dyadobacter beijingensis]GGM90938.1 hypothetical protein GCM10010967_24990 [Dyadobacter beijingensis]
MINNYLGQVFRSLPAPSLVLLTDVPKFTIADANDAYLALVHMTRDELIGKGFYEAFPNNPYNSVPPWNSLLEKLVADGLPNEAPVSKYLVTPAGADKPQVRYLHASNTPVRDEAGQITCILRTVTDVTEVTLAQQTHNPFTSGKFLNETLRIARVGSWECDLINQVIVWSDVAKEIHEVPADYQPGFHTAIDFCHPGPGRDAFVQAISEAIADGKFFDLELLIDTPSGREKWIRVTGKADAVEGVCTRIYGVIQDIHNRKMVEQELLQSHRQFESLIQTVDGIFWEADASTFQFSFVSDQVRSILGYSPEEWLGDPDFWQKHIYPDDREQAVRFCHRETQEMRNHTFDYRMIARDGRLVWIKDVVSVISENGKPELLRGLMVDITKARQEEHELKLLVSVITNTNDAVLIAESDPRDVTGLRILYVNAAFTRITGYAPAEVLGKSPALLKGFSPARNDFDRLKDAIYHLEPLKGATLRYLREDEECYINLALLPVTDVRGVHTHWIAIGHDVTDRLRYISEIEERNHKLQEIAWMQSHVIRAPLARLMGLIDLISNYQHSETEKTELLDHVLTSAYALDEIIRDISSKTERI